MSGRFIFPGKGRCVNLKEVEVQRHLQKVPGSNSMLSKAQQLTRSRAFWLITALFVGFVGMANYHYSTINQIPSDGPLTIGFPMTFYRKVCPMVVVGAGACQAEISALGIAVDLIGCIALAMVSACLSMHFARKHFVRRPRFWIITSAVFSLTFLLLSLATALHSASHHRRALEMGFPAVYLYEYAGESFNAINLAADLVTCFVAAFLCVAAFFKR
jgi:hypothetical protein